MSDDAPQIEAKQLWATSERLGYLWVLAARAEAVDVFMWNLPFDCYRWRRYSPEQFRQVAVRLVGHFPQVRRQDERVKIARLDDAAHSDRVWTEDARRAGLGPRTG